jgi:hypothetical protein
MSLFKLLPNTILALLLTGMIFVPISQLQAGASNKTGYPYGNGTFFPNNGTFSAIERSSNGFLGVLQFSTSLTNSSPNSVTNNTGIATIYADGQQFTGSAFGSLNGSTIAATYIGFYGLTAQIATASRNGATINSVTYTTQILTNTCSGQFSANLYNTYPTQNFTGNGVTGIKSFVVTTDAQFVTTIEATNIFYNTTVSGSRLTPGTF